MIQWLEAFLASRRVVLAAVGLSVLLSLPSLSTGWHVDDIYHRAQFLEIGPLTDSSNMTHRMFDFLSGDPQEILAFKELGVLPWWSYDRLKISFWRPLSSFTHVIDYTLWPQSALLMHLHSVLWVGLLVLVTTLWYREMIPTPFVAGLAAMLYAIDDARGLPVAFLANRNAIVATLFGVLSLSWHHRWRQEGASGWAIASSLAFGAALLSGESGIGAAAYLFAYACFLEKRTGRGRLGQWRSIVPQAAVGLSWLLAYKVMGYGTAGSDFYLDPVGQPEEWFGAFLIRAPLLLLGQWFVPPSSFAFVWTESQSVIVALFGVLVLGIVITLLWPILRREPVARFLALGMFVAVVPITAGYPHDRLLFFVGLGAMGLLAMLLKRLFGPDGGGLLRLAGVVLVVTHVVISIPLYLLMSTAMASQEAFYAPAPRSLPDDPRLGSQRLVVVNQQSFFYGQYVLLVRLMDGMTAPAGVLMLAPGTSPLTLERVSEHSLRVIAADGYMNAPFDNVYRARSATMPEGYRVELSIARIEVESVGENGLPRQVLFTFSVPLEEDSLRWVRFEEGRYVPFPLPAVGETVDIEPVELNLLSPPEYGDRDP